MSMIPLTVRSHFSLMWGASSVQDLCKAARKMGYPRLALTDTDNLYGLWSFITACNREGIKPIIGAEVTDPKTGTRVVCLVENADGYQNLCKLLTCRHMGENYILEESEDKKKLKKKTDSPYLQSLSKNEGVKRKPKLGLLRHSSDHIHFSLKRAIPMFAKGIIVLTRDSELLQFWHETGVNVFAAMPRNPLHSDHHLRKTAKHLGIDLVATPGSFFLYPENHLVHQYLRAINKNTCLSRLSQNDIAPKNAWFGSSREYQKRFSICPESLRQTFVLSERLVFTRPDFGLVMPPWKNQNGKNSIQTLRELTYEGARKRYGFELSEPVVDRIEHELKTISQMNFSSYFLVVKDIVKKSPRTCGRGSGAASIVAYCLGITNLCPVKHNLYFERFLNPGRKDPPDIDVDFAWDERDQVLEKVLEHYHGHAAMVCNHVTFKPRMAIREVARVFGLTDTEINRISKRLQYLWTGDNSEELFDRLRKLPELKHLDFLEPWPEIIHIANQIIGIPRYLSVHPGGVIITPRPIYEYVPVEKAAKGVPVLQWEKDSVEEAGLVKIDLLGNRSLGVVRDAINNVQENNHQFQEIGWEPEDDFDTQQAVAQGQTMGCFYIESPAMRLLQQKAGVGDFEHLVIHSSIIRPAANELIREYIRRLHGGSWDPIHPFLKDVLAETFGIMVYQEDVSKVAVSLAGFTHIEADGLRKIMAKKDREYQLQDYYFRFAKGAGARGVTEDQIEAIWAMMMSFRGYSFCKPHSASYARVSFQAAYLKVHFPAEFMAAVISNQGGFYNTFAYVSEARRLGLKVLPPDVNISEIRWTGQEKTIRVGLLSIKMLTSKTRNRIISERKKAVFSSLNDFLDRTCPDEPEAKALIHCGALDHLDQKKSRTALIWKLSSRHNSAQQNPDGKNSSTYPLFSNPKVNAIPLPIFPPENPEERFRREFAVLGFLCDRHPMALYDHAFKNIKNIKAREIPKFINKQICFAGWLITGKIVHTKDGIPMEFLTFEDDTGLVETTFFPDVYERFCHIIDLGGPYILNGTVEQDWGAVTLTVKTIQRW
jgi:error-prone DNA polymerase